jgi:hypothetical protein
VSGRLPGVVLIVALATACSVAPEASPAPDPSSLGPTATPTPAQSASPASPTFSPGASPGADAPRWEQIGQITAQPYVTELLGFDAGYVAFAGEYITGSSDAWFSVDGKDWQQAPLERSSPCRSAGEDDDGESRTDLIEAGASSGQAVLLVGSTAEVNPANGYCATRAVAWLTHDGRTWQRSEAFGGAPGTVAQAVWFTPDGWEAAVALHIEDDHDAIVRTSVWRSSDGLHWQQVADEAWEPGHLIGSGPPVAAGSDAQGARLISTAWWVAVGPPDSPLVHSTLLRISADGHSWNELDAPFARGNPPGLVTHILPPGAGPAGTWLLVTHDAYLRNATGWRSADLRDWESIDMPRRQLDAVVRLPDGLLVAGCNRAEERCGQFISADGSEWMEITPRLQGSVSVASGPAGVLLVGVVSGRVWRLAR